MTQTVIGAQYLKDVFFICQQRGFYIEGGKKVFDVLAILFNYVNVVAN